MRQNITITVLCIRLLPIRINNIIERYFTIGLLLNYGIKYIFLIRLK